MAADNAAVHASGADQGELRRRNVPSTEPIAGTVERVEPDDKKKQVIKVWIEHHKKKKKKMKEEREQS